MRYPGCMRFLSIAVGCTFALVGCGGGDDGEPLVCAPPAAALPATGELISPDQLPALDGCVTGGLVELPGRWFQADLTRLFTFSYPRYAGSCEAGFRNQFAPADDADERDGRTRHTWTDGTRLFQRTWRRFTFPGGGVFERVSASVVCMKSDGTLGYAWGAFDSDNGVSTGTGTGTRFAPLDEPAKGLTRVGSLAAMSADEPVVGYNVVVEGDVAFVVGPWGLQLIDVHDPAAPRPITSVTGDFEDGFNDVRVVRGGGHVVAFASPLTNDVTAVFDVTDPAAPVRLADLREYSHSVQVRVDGARTLLYLATYENSVPIYDITDPTRPMRLGAPVVPGPDAGIHDLTADGTIIYANNTTSGMVAIDVSAGLGAAVERGRIATTYSHASWAATVGGRRIVIHGDEGMTPEGGAFMRILDGDPASPGFLTELARWQTRPDVGIHNMMIVGTKAYVSYYQDGIRVVELADPVHPREVAHYNTWDDATAPGGAFEGAVGVRVVGNLIYVADIGQGLIILRETP